jgi:hypothetical protein
MRWTLRQQAEVGGAARKPLDEEVDGIVEGVVDRLRRQAGSVVLVSEAISCSDSRFWRTPPKA